MYKLDSSFIKDMRLASGLFKRADMDWYNKFFRYGCINPQDQLTTTREYLFFTRPNLTILNDSDQLDSGSDDNPSSISNSTYFKECYNRYLPVIRQLQRDRSGGLPFCNLLSGTVCSSWEIPSYENSMVETAATSYGDQVRYVSNSLATEADGYNFSLEFQDTKYLEVYNFFKMYSEWENLKSQNLVRIDDAVITESRELIDQMALYKIVVGADFETIVFYAKGWGVFPLTAEPRDVFANMDILTSPLRYSISFHAEWIESMDPIILDEFNECVESCKNMYSSDIPLYDTNNHRVNGVMCNIPYVVYDSSVSSVTNGTWKLKWR